MLKLLTNLFAGKRHEAPVAPAPYKVETPKLVDNTPKATATPAPKAAKKPVVKKATTARPKKPRAPKV